MNLQDKITIMGMTDIGLVRRKNEDSIGYDSALGLAVLADGMGGHRGGDIASSMTVDTIIGVVQKKLPKIKPGHTDSKSGYSLESICIQEANDAANERVGKDSEANAMDSGMGTTIVGLQLENKTDAQVKSGE